MKRLKLILPMMLLLFAVWCAGARADFGVKEFSLGFPPEAGTAENQAGSHPGSVITRLSLNTSPGTTVSELPDGALRNLELALPPGLVGRPGAVPQCSQQDFLELQLNKETSGTLVPECPDASAVGWTIVKGFYEDATPGSKPLFVSAPVWNLKPDPGTVLKIGFWVQGLVPVVIRFTVSEQAPYHVVAKISDTSQLIPIYGAKLVLWGDPASATHDSERGHCISSSLLSPRETEELVFAFEGCSIPAKITNEPFVTLPTQCQNPLSTGYLLTSWEGGLDADQSVGSKMVGCERLRFSPSISAKPTTGSAVSPTGLDFNLDVADPGLTNPTGQAQSDVRKTEVTLPSGFTTNPSLAEGLAACSVADLARETATSEPGQGCPQASKIGTVEVETPLLDEMIDGDLYVATPYENEAGNSLLGVYMVLKNRNLGISIKQPIQVLPDPSSGQLTAIADELPQLPFSHFRLHFRGGARSPLSSPSLCGEYAAKAVLTPWSGGPPVTTNSMFSIVTGPESGPCLSGGKLPFHPGLEAGTVNNAAGHYSPFTLQLTRKDGEQEISRFSIKLPPGVTGKLAGIPFCRDPEIAAARARTGPHGGQEELERPSCPAESELGRTLVGAGIGPSLTYVPGKVYLAGPYQGSPMSIVAITAAKVGPFDLGTVVVRQALRVNPVTAEVFVDSTGADPLPHIIKGIPVDLRDIRVYVDRPDFTLNPTSCARQSTTSTVLGSGQSFTSEADDTPFTATSAFQAASCASLGFKPKISLSLKGGTRRGATPAFKAVVTARKGDANIGRAKVTLPHSEFLEQAHIKTVCTRVQFNAGNGNGEKCPKASVYGRARATTPLLDETLSGPVYLRSSNHELPDLVAALHSKKIDIDLDGRIDSGKGGGIRNTFEAVPDAPVTKFTLEMFGGKKSLLVNSTSVCEGSHRAISEFTGQNGRVYNTTPELKAQCGKKKSKKAKGSSEARSAALGIPIGW